MLTCCLLFKTTAVAEQKFSPPLIVASNLTKLKAGVATAEEACSPPPESYMYQNSNNNNCEKEI